MNPSRPYFWRIRKYDKCCYSISTVLNMYEMYINLTWQYSWHCTYYNIACFFSFSNILWLWLSRLGSYFYVVTYVFRHYVTFSSPCQARWQFWSSLGLSETLNYVDNGRDQCSLLIHGRTWQVLVSEKFSLGVCL